MAAFVDYGSPRVDLCESGGIGVAVLDDYVFGSCNATCTAALLLDSLAKLLDKVLLRTTCAICPPWRWPSAARSTLSLSVKMNFVLVCYTESLTAEDSKVRGLGPWLGQDT